MVAQGSVGPLGDQVGAVVDQPPESASGSLRSRRGLLGLGAGLGAAAFASAFRPSGASAANGDSVRVGRDHQGTSPTTFTNADGTALRAVTQSAASAIEAIGEKDTNAVAVYGIAWGGAGVHGKSKYNVGVRGEGYSNAGVEGFSPYGPGMIARSAFGPGITAHSNEKAGVEATSEQAAAVDATGPTAIKATGRVEMNRSGRATVSVGSDSVKVRVPGGVSATSLGFANLRTNAEDLAVKLVTPIEATGELLIRLNKRVRTKAYLSWMVIG